MKVLVLRLRGPLQAWGSASRFVRRTTEPHPTKSGVVGLLAAALGRRRRDRIEDLLALRLGVRLDQPGQLLRDFQTAHTLHSGKSMPLSQRYYLADAVFAAFVEGADDVIETIDGALRAPTFPLYLGRRSCPPVGPITLGAREAGLDDVLAAEPWHASPWWQKRTRSVEVRVETVVDALADDADVETLNDAPISFDPERRLYAMRAVTRGFVVLRNPSFEPAAVGTVQTDHDAFAALRGD